jgi:hypothetical protein
MTTENDNLQTGENGDGQTQTTQDNPDIRNLRDKAKRADTLEADNQRLQRELNLSKAGISDLSEKQLKALDAAHDGESTPEALRKTAEELGFAEPIPETSTEEQQAHQQVQQAASGATKPGEQSPADQYAQANTPQEVLDIARRNGVPVAQDMQ